MIDPTTIIYSPVDIDENATIGPFCVIGSPAVPPWPAMVPTQIKRDVILSSHIVIGSGSCLEKGVNCEPFTYIGNGTRVKQGVQIMYSAKIYDRVVIGEGCWVGGFICNDAVLEKECIVLGRLAHRFVDAEEGVAEVAPIIGARAFVGFGAVIIGDVNIGAGAYVAAGAVVTRSVPMGRLFAGVPARDHGAAPSPFLRWREN